ncbi:MAG: nucleotidyltransferase [Bacilli bacterium]|nr:nucleotidyltransferase [Bacilli bacterium]
MKSVGIICEYNPFHNGHIYHIEKVKELFPDSTIILVMSGNYTQRGDMSIIDKWTKTDIALNYVDLVVELPFMFSVASADIFAYGAINILKNLGVSNIIFGTENLNEKDFEKIALAQRSEQFNILVKKYLDSGINYPTSLAKATYDLTGIKADCPNDLLGISYVKELINTNIKPITIKRTNDFHSKSLDGSIVSASSIRDALKNGIDVKKYVPSCTYNKLNNLHFNEGYFDLLKYKIISEIDYLDKYVNVDEGIENRIKKYIYESISLEDLISKVKTKRYTYNKLNRMFTYILCGFTKEENTKKLEYIRILGMNKKGRLYLKSIKNKSNLPIITKYSNKYKGLETELKTSYIYYSKEKDKVNLTLMEYKHKPIIK